MSDTAQMHHFTDDRWQVVDVLVIKLTGHVQLTAYTNGSEVMIFRPSAELVASLRQALDDCQRPMGLLTTEQEKPNVQ